MGSFVPPVLTMKLSLFKAVGPLNMSNHVQFSWLLLNLSSRVPLQVRGATVSKQVSVLFAYHSVMDDPHYLSFLRLSYRISKIEIITSTSYFYCGDPML